MGNRTGIWSRLTAWIVEGPRRRSLLFGIALCLALPVLFSWPEFPLRGDSLRAWKFHWDRVVELKVQNLWHDYTVDFPAENNEAKRNFRLTVPALAHLAGGGMAGVDAICLVLQLVLIGALLLAAERACGDRLAGLAAALAIAGTYVGTSVWRDVCRWFDHCAHAFLALALAVRNPWVAGAAVFAAAFTDERALLAVPLLILFHSLTGAGRGTLAALVASVPLYVGARLAVAHWHGLSTPAAGLVEKEILGNNLELAPFGAWFALEGGWLLVALAVRRAVAAGRPREAFAFAAAALLPVVAAGGVHDFTRSATYAFPATLAALALLRSVAPAAESLDASRRPALWAAVLSLAVSNLFIMTNVFVESSAPLHALGRLLHPRP